MRLWRRSRSSATSRRSASALAVGPDLQAVRTFQETRLSAMVCRWAPWLLALALAAGCGSSASVVPTDDVVIKQELLGGVDRIRSVHDRHKLNAELARI